MGLIGVAINDSIVVLAAIRADEKARAGDREQMAAVVSHCTRHIIATTLTTIVGFLPLILSGGGFWPPLAVTIAGGVGGATLLALYVVPAMHILSHRRGT
jgi:multidrug efflux pump subunit AcrB